MELVIAALPNDVARPATVGACQVRAQWSRLLVRITTLTNFCISQLSSLVQRAELRAPKASVPSRSRISAKRRGDQVEGLVPGRLLELAVLADERRREAVGAVDHVRVVAAFDAQVRRR